MDMPSVALIPATPLCDTRMSVVAVRARGMPVVVQQNVLGSVVCIVTRRKRMSNLGKLGVDIWDRRVEIRTAVVASNAVLLIRPAQQAHRPLRVVWHMAGDTRVLRHRAIAAKVRLPGYFVGCHGVCAGCPSRERIDLPGHGAGGIMAGKTHLRIRTVADQEVQRQLIDGLNMRVMTGSALNVTVDQRHFSRRIACLALPSQRRYQVDRIFDGQYQAEGMRTLEVGPEDVGGIHGSSHCDLAIDDGLAGRDGSVVAAQTQVAIGAQGRLSTFLVIGRTGVERIGCLLYTSPSP